MWVQNEYFVVNILGSFFKFGMVRIYADYYVLYSIFSCVPIKTKFKGSQKIISKFLRVCVLGGRVYTVYTYYIAISCYRWSMPLKYLGNQYREPWEYHLNFLIIQLFFYKIFYLNHHNFLAFSKQIILFKQGNRVVWTYLSFIINFVCNKNDHRLTSLGQMNG